MKSLPLFTTAQVAERHSVTPRRILAIAAARSIQPAYESRVKMWTLEQADRLKPGPGGRPKKEHE